MFAKQFIKQNLTSIIKIKDKIQFGHLHIVTCLLNYGTVVVFYSPVLMSTVL